MTRISDDAVALAAICTIVLAVVTSLSWWTMVGRLAQ